MLPTPPNLELDVEGEILFADLRTFVNVLRYFIATGQKSREDDLKYSFTISDDGAFRIQHAPTLAATGARG
jgi:hypothetical protein